MSVRKIKVYSTKGQRLVEIQSSAATWGELKKDFDKEGIDYKGMQVVCNETKAILSLDGAVLPVASGVNGGLADCVIFLSATKMKAGTTANWESASYADCRTEIKKLRASSDEAVEYFGDYTHDTTDTLRNSLENWYQEHPVKKTPAKKKTVVETIQETNSSSNKELVGKVMNLLNEALGVLGSIEEVSESSEFESLKEQAELIEFELFQLA